MRKHSIQVLVCAVLLAIVAGLALEWKSIVPNARSFTSMAVDTLNHRAILFGGVRGEAQYNDLWEIALDDSCAYGMQELAASGQTPDPRWGHRAIYDPGNQQMLVFGGTVDGSQVDELWTLGLHPGSETWTRLNPGGTAPSSRETVYTIYHPGRNCLIVFGGAIYGTRYNDLFELELDSLAWHEIAVSGPKPSVRSEGCAVYDPAEDRMVIFGGRDNSGFFNDVWALDLTRGNESWTQLSPGGTAPDIRAGSVWGFDQDNRKMYVFGGWNYPPFHFYGDLYELDLVSMTWSRLAPSGSGPDPRRGAAGTFDPFNDNLMFFGGDDYDSHMGDAWYVQLPSPGLSEWQPLPQQGPRPNLHITTVSSGTVRIRYELPRPGQIDLRILDATGRVVRSLYSGQADFGSGLILWDGRDDAGRKTSTGAYYCYLQTGRTGLSKKFILTE